MKWFVVYTKPNHEIKVAEKMMNSGVTAYCPVYTQIKQYSDRKKKVQKPLMPSYILVKLSEADRKKVFCVPGVIRYLFWLGKPAEVREEEVQKLKQNLNGVFNEVEFSKLTKGQKYKINSGLFKDQTGEVLSVLKNKIRLVLPQMGLLLTLNRARA